MTEKLPTQAGRKALLRIAAGKKPFHNLYGKSHGCFGGTIASLRRRGLVSAENSLTESGLQMVERLTVTPEVTNG